MEIQSHTSTLVGQCGPRSFASELGLRGHTTAIPTLLCMSLISRDPSSGHSSPDEPTLIVKPCLALSVYLPDQEYARTDPGYLQRSSCSYQYRNPPLPRDPRPSSFQRVICPRPSLRRPRAQIINPSSTMPWKRTRRKPREISDPIHYLPNSKPAILPTRSSLCSESKSLRSTNLAVSTTS